MIRLWPIAIAAALGAGLMSAPCSAQTAPPAAATPAPAPGSATARAPLRIIVEVPDDAAGRAFVQQTVAPAPPAPAPAPPSPVPASATRPAGGEMSSTVADRIDRLRGRAMALIEAAPDVPQDLRAAAHAFDSMGNRVDIIWLALATSLFVAGGVAARNAAWWAARGLLARILDAPGETPGQRVRLHAMRLAFGVFALAAYVLGSLGAFLLFPWPPIFRELVLLILAIAVVNRLAVTVGRILFAPGGRHDYFRVLPMTRERAAFSYRWLVVLATMMALGWGLFSALRLIGVPDVTRDVVAAVWLAVCAGAGLYVVWARRRHLPPLPAARAAQGRIGALLVSLAILLSWGFAVMIMDGPFWTVVVLTALPILLRAVHDGVRNVARLDDAETAVNTSVVGWAVVVERFLRAVLVFLAAVIAARAWQIDLGAIAMGETPATLAIRSLLRIVIIIMAADVVWRLARAIIDGQILHATERTGSDPIETRRRQRIATLLPILKNFLFVIIAATALLMILDAMGIQIGPLLAGAGVVGIAVGFGAQTLVKDIISGIFYLLDDAFRVGEYVQTKSYKGTVESFSLRSVKLRHHRGPITTVPFGELGAVQNLSRDWVIDKITVGVTYDTDLDKVKRVIKEIGKQLLADEELKPFILETLKMQGVDAMSEFAIEIRMKMMTKPGEQFVVRRRAYALIKKAFEANDINFAVPTVKVSGEAHETAAVVAADAAATRVRAATEAKAAAE